MPWIESHTVLSRHRKLAELARALRLRRAHAMGHLHALWHAALEQQEDGDLSSWSDEFIAEQSDFPGDAPQYVRLLQEHGFLDGRLLHDWLDYAGRYLIKRYGSKRKDRLFEIWAKHGRVYGEDPEGAKGDQGETKRRPKRDPKETLPNQPHQPNPPSPDDGAGGDGNGTPPQADPFLAEWDQIVQWWTKHRRPEPGAYWFTQDDLDVWRTVIFGPRGLLVKSAIVHLEGMHRQERYADKGFPYFTTVLANIVKKKIRLEDADNREAAGV